MRSDVPSLNVVEVDEDELKEDPAGVDGKELPVLANPSTVAGNSERIDLVVDGDGDLHGQVHDEKTLGAELEWKNFDGVGDEKTGPGEGVRHTMEPDEENVDVADGGLAGCAVLLARDGGAHEEDQHAECGSQEQWATSDAVDQQGTANGDEK